MSLIAHAGVIHPKEQIQIICVLMYTLKCNYNFPLGNCERVYFMLSLCN